MAVQLSLLPFEKPRTGSPSRRVAAPTPTPQRDKRSPEAPASETHLDAHTREVGRRGIEAARRALAEAIARSTAA